MVSTLRTFRDLEEIRSIPVSTQQRYDEFLTLMESEGLLSFVKAATLEESGTHDYQSITLAEKEVVMGRLRQMLVVVRHMRSPKEDA
ncbi:hypothetical protein GCM10007094_22940 [Pseudovibrio japonicus]|uniref:Uncharacterized protein n=1 Tax=Pseudovibrio japonicus TaxID=366534 RepID=A0ABQ3EGR3_9HYPH|nr:hypothetical protein GCM10007094_22940 [Pseudovibrio japonicus]